MRWLAVLPCLSLLLIAGCDTTPPFPAQAPMDDAGSEAPAIDAGDTSGNDSGTPNVDMDGGITVTVPDAGSATEVDAGSVTEPDAGTITEPDAGVTMVPDAGMTTVPDAGSGGIDGVPDSPAKCSSGVYWLLGDLGTDLMHPGKACIQCHSMGRGPGFTAAGTVYPTTHEPDDCDGVNGGVQVIITDAAGNQVQLTPNIVGTFHTNTPIAFPYTAQVISGGRTRSMVTPQMIGDCNSCHTQDGANGAPGRIVAP